MAVLIQQFIADLTASGLVSDDDVRSAVRSLAAEQRADPQALANCLIRSGQLTQYQARSAYRGRARLLVVGKYLLLERMGQDGIGRIYKARHRKLDRIVLLKVLVRAHASNPDAVKRFRREMRIVASLTHPNIVQAFDAGQNRGRLYLAMEYVDGTDVGALVESCGPLELPRAVGYVLQAARGLEFAHQQGVVHRDIKPANLMLDRDGMVKVLDFGLATFQRGGGRSTHLIRAGGGQVDFMPPERLRPSGKMDERSDIFSLGCVLHLLLTGRPVFSGASVKDRLSGDSIKEVPSLRPQLPGAPPALDRVFQRMVAPEAGDRFRSMEDVVRGLAAFAGESDGDRPTEFLVNPGSAGPSTVNREDRTRQGIDKEADNVQAAVAPPRRVRQRQFTANRRPSRHRRNPAVWGLLVVVALIVGGVTAWKFLGHPPDVDEIDNGLAGTGSVVEPRGSGENDPPDSPATAPPVLPAVAAEGVVQVFVLAGQSNMGGHGHVSDLADLVDDPDERGTFGHLKTPEGNWIERDDVWIRCFRNGRQQSQGALTVGFGWESDRIGPELGFGHVIGNALDDPVLIVKVAQGTLSLMREGRPPSSGGTSGQFYQHLVNSVDDTLENVTTLFPELAGLRCQITGFVWFQAWNDRNLSDEYAVLLRHLIYDLRTAWNVPGLPVVIGEFGQHGEVDLVEEPDRAHVVLFRAAQKSVADLPEFHGTVRFVETTPYSREWPQPVRYHYGEDAETFYRIGEAFGTAMVELLEESPDVERAGAPL